MSQLSNLVGESKERNWGREKGKDVRENKERNWDRRKKGSRG